MLSLPSSRSQISSPKFDEIKSTWWGVHCSWFYPIAIGVIYVGFAGIKPLMYSSGGRYCNLTEMDQKKTTAHDTAHRTH